MSLLLSPSPGVLLFTHKFKTVRHHFFNSQPPLVDHRVSQSLNVARGTWHSLGLLLLPLNAMEWSLPTSSPVSLRLVGGTAFPCSTGQQALSLWEGSHQPPPTTASSLPWTVREVDQCQIWLALLWKLVSTNFLAKKHSGYLFVFGSPFHSIPSL